jgi:hypothetical protein
MPAAAARLYLMHSVKMNKFKRRVATTHWGAMHNSMIAQHAPADGLCLVDWYSSAHFIEHANQMHAKVASL